MAQVRSGHDGRGDDRSALAQRPECPGQCVEVEVPGAVIGLVPEGLVDEDDVERPVEQPEGGGAQRAGVGGVEQAVAIGSGDGVQQGLLGHDVAVAVPVLRGQGADHVGAGDRLELDRLARVEDVQLHHRVRSDPVPAQVHGQGRPPHVQRRPWRGPSTGQQEGGVEVIGVAVRDEHVLDVLQRDAGVARKVRCRGSAVDEEQLVDECRARCARAPGSPLGSARRAAAEGIRPAVRRSGAEEGYAHRQALLSGCANSTGASKAALRDMRRRARSTGRPATRIRTTVSAARGMS